MSWYLVYRYKWVGIDLVKDNPHPVDGVYAAKYGHACKIAATRNNYRTDEKFLAFRCSSERKRMHAEELDAARELEVNLMDAEEFSEWMSQPAYSGAGKGT